MFIFSILSYVLFLKTTTVAVLPKSYTRKIFVIKVLTIGYNIKIG